MKKKQRSKCRNYSFVKVPKTKKAKKKFREDLALFYQLVSAARRSPVIASVLYHGKRVNKALVTKELAKYGVLAKKKPRKHKKSKKSYTRAKKVLRSEERKSRKKRR
jgi:hypothetical protein